MAARLYVSSIVERADRYVSSPFVLGIRRGPQQARTTYGAEASLAETRGLVVRRHAFRKSQRSGLDQDPDLERLARALLADCAVAVIGASHERLALETYGAAQAPAGDRHSFVPRLDPLSLAR